MTNIALTLFMSGFETKAGAPNLFFLFFSFFVSMWFLKALFLLILPVPVVEKRFLALDIVFIFGIISNNLRGKGNSIFSFILVIR